MPFRPKDLEMIPNIYKNNKFQTSMTARIGIFQIE
jgi:hypothetical protein